MTAILRKEISQFFSSITGYVAVILFLAANGLFLFIFPDTSLFNDGYASLERFFQTAPWIFLLLIPAITMRSLSDEWGSGTMELLSTRPVSEMQIVLGKYLACVILVLFSLLPTLFYYFTIRALATGGVDNGGIAGSYVGLFLLGSAFAAIGTWASSLTGHSVVAFLLGVFACFLVYSGFDALSHIPALEGGMDYYLQLSGIQYHYASVSRGVLDLRDIIYFLSLVVVFLYLTRLSLARIKWKA